MPFQILIPAYLPKEFDRAGVTDPGGPARSERRADGPAHLRTRSRAPPLFVRQWVPVNPDMEILAGSRPDRDEVGQGLAARRRARAWSPSGWMSARCASRSTPPI